MCRLAAAARLPKRWPRRQSTFRDRYGFGALKLKGSRDARADVAKTQGRARASCPTCSFASIPTPSGRFPIRSWAAQQLLPLGLEYLEDPCIGLEGMARVRQTVGIPLCTNMCVVRLEEFAPAMRMGAVDVIHGDVHKWGGINAVKRLAALCDALRHWS